MGDIWSWVCGLSLGVYLQSLLLDYSSGIFSSKRPLPIDVTNDIYICIQAYIVRFTKP